MQITSAPIARAHVAPLAAGSQGRYDYGDSYDEPLPPMGALRRMGLGAMGGAMVGFSSFFGAALPLGVAVGACALGGGFVGMTLGSLFKPELPPGAQRAIDAYKDPRNLRLPLGLAATGAVLAGLGHAMGLSLGLAIPIGVGAAVGAVGGLLARG
ncbi:MAG: hypothetical protein AB1758_16820 [Candidatus Eremiobacterota bacterium]